MQNERLKIRLLGKVEFDCTDAMCNKCLKVFTARIGGMVTCPHCGAGEDWKTLWNTYAGPDDDNQ